MCVAGMSLIGVQDTHTQSLKPHTLYVSTSEVSRTSVPRLRPQGQIPLGKREPIFLLAPLYVRLLPNGSYVPSIDHRGFILLGRHGAACRWIAHPVRRTAAYLRHGHTRITRVSYDGHDVRYVRDRSTSVDRLV